MSNRERKAEQRIARSAVEQEAYRARLVATPRHFDVDLDYVGAGELLFRLVWQRAFEPCLVWEIRSVGDQLVAFEASGVEPGAPMVVGHERLQVEDATLRSALDQLSVVSLPLTPSLADAAIADGATFFATIRVGFATSLRLTWCDGSAPEAWASSVDSLLRVRDVLQRPESISSHSFTPWLVECSESTARLVRLSSGDFHVWVAGALGSLACGPDHILAIETLADALKEACGDDLEVVPATITSKATGEVWSSYRELRPATQLGGPDELPAARLSGRKAWHFQGRHLFIGPQVKDALVPLGLLDLDFSLGFSHFAGMRGY